MTRLNALDPAQATGKTKELFAAIESKLGVVPNMMRTMGNSPAFLKAYLDMSGTLAGGALGSKTGELIAMAVAETNSCDYCLSAHSYIGANLLKMDGHVLTAARNGVAENPKTEAALQLAKALVTKKGWVSDADVSAAKAAGITDGELGEIVGHVALNIMTNYLNITAKTEIDFPVVEAYNAVAL